MSMQVTYQQDYPGGAGEEPNTLEGFNVEHEEKPVTHPSDNPCNGLCPSELNASKTIVVPSDKSSTNFGGQVSSHSTVQAKTCATFRGDK